MVSPACTDDQFMALFDKIGATKLSVKLGVNERSVYARRRRLEAKYSLPLQAPSRDYSRMENTARLHIEVPDGVVLVGGDGHYWPGKASTAHRAFVKFASELKPKAVLYNGDAFDGAAISRHPTIGWENQPSVIEEIEAAKLRLGEIEKAAPRRCQLIWPAGNHDLRYETSLATKVPEFRKVRGFHLKDSFPAWKTAWSCWINNKVVVKHRINGGAGPPDKGPQYRTAIDHSVLMFRSSRSILLRFWLNRLYCSCIQSCYIEGGLISRGSTRIVGFRPVENPRAEFGSNLAELAIIPTQMR